VTPEAQYEVETETYLHRMRTVRATKREFYEGLRAALAELEIEIQACKETLDD